MRSISGRAKAAVLPVPVCACPIRSRPASRSGIARAWIGVGASKPDVADGAGHGLGQPQVGEARQLGGLLRRGRRRRAFGWPGGIPAARAELGRAAFGGGTFVGSEVGGHTAVYPPSAGTALGLDRIRSGWGTLKRTNVLPNGRNFVARFRFCVGGTRWPILSVSRARGRTTSRTSRWTFPRDKLVVITGLSGSGKSSLAFDTIYAEGQRRYVESLSAYARQFLGQMDKPDVDHIEGLSPAVSIDQKSTSKNPRSTVGTVTEIYDYLRLLFARVGIPHDPVTGKPLTKQTVEQMVDRTLELPEGTRIQVLAPVVRGRKGEYKKEIDEIRAEGFARVRIDGTVYDLSSDEIPTWSATSSTRSRSSWTGWSSRRQGWKSAWPTRLETGAEVGQGRRSSWTCMRRRQPLEFTGKLRRRPTATFNFEEIEPRLFSFNSPYGACPDCHGLGIKTEFDPDLIIPDKGKSIEDGRHRALCRRHQSGNTNEWALGPVSRRRRAVRLLQRDADRGPDRRAVQRPDVRRVKGNVTVDVPQQVGPQPAVHVGLRRRRRDAAKAAQRDRVGQHQGMAGAVPERTSPAPSARASG